jgi:hypothetical protein
MENQEEQPVIQPQIPVQPAEQPKITKNLLPKWPLIIVGIILLATLLTGAFVLSKNFRLNQKPALKTAPVTTPTATWKTYTNSKVGVEFKYPPTWTAKFDPNWALAVFLDNHPFEIIPQSEPPSTSISIAFNEQGNIGERSFRETTLAQGQQNIEKLFDQNTIRNKLLTIGGKDAVQITGQGTGMLSGYLEYTLIQMDNKLLIIELKNQNFENIYQQLLSTLKFTDQTTQAITSAPKQTPIPTQTPTPIPTINEIASWKTYADPNYAFQIQYPQTWTLRTTYGNSVRNTNNDRVAGIDINTLTPGYGTVLVVNVIDPKGKTIEGWLSSNISNTYVPTKVNYQGYVAYKYQYPTQDNRPGTVEIYYQYKDKIIFLAWNLISAVDQPTADQIMSSLKFSQ